MDKKILLILLAILILLLPSTLATSDNEVVSGNIEIVCTNSILADFTVNVLKNVSDVTIEYIMPPGVCPAHFDVRPSDISLIASADIVVSLGWEPWLAGLLNSSGNVGYSEIICSGLGPWNIPNGAIKYVEKISSELTSILPELNNTIQQNTEEYIEAINETAEQLKTLVNASGYIGKNVICMQWQKSFVEWLGFNVTISYAPPERLSTQDMLNISNVAKSKDVCAIIDNLQSGTDFGANIASESGISHIILTNFPGAIPGTDTYIDMIKYNTNQLISGISSFEYKKGEISNLLSQISAVEFQRNLSIVAAAILALIAIILAVLYKKK